VAWTAQAPTVFDVTRKAPTAPSPAARPSRELRCVRQERRVLATLVPATLATSKAPIEPNKASANSRRSDVIARRPSQAPQLAPSAGCGFASYPHGRRRGSPRASGRVDPQADRSLASRSNASPRRSSSLDHAAASLTRQTRRGRQGERKTTSSLRRALHRVSRPFRRRFERGRAENGPHGVDFSRGGCFAWCRPEVSRRARPSLRLLCPHDL